MWLFGIVCFLCLLLAPILISYFASSLLLGSAVWAGRTFLLFRSSRRLLAESAARLVPASTDSAELLDSGFVRRNAWTSDWEAVIEGFHVLVRAQPRTVDESGAVIGFPWSRQDRRATRQVLAASIIIDLRHNISRSMCMHANFTHAEETTLGSEALIAGLIDGRVRRAVRPGDQLSIGDGLLSCDSPFALSAGLLDQLVAALLHMARRLVSVSESDGIDAAALLLENLTHDPSDDVRTRSVEAFARDLPGRKSEALEIALRDPSPHVRFAAARHLDDVETSFATVWTILDERQTDDGLAERALRHLLRRFPAATTLPVLEQVLLRKGHQLLRIAVRHLGEIRHAPAVPWLDRVAKERSHPEIAVAIAQAIGGIGAAEGEATLLDLLRSCRHEVVLAAAEALGHVGSRHAIAPLKTAEKRYRKLGLTTQTSIQMITARLGPARNGALSLVDRDDGGRLSLKTNESGTLSSADHGAERERA